MRNKQFLRDAGGRLTFEMSEIPADRYARLRDGISAEFQLVPHNSMITNDFDVAFQDFRHEGEIVGIEWDNWTGFSMVAQTPASESLMKNIAAWLLKSPWATAQSAVN